MALTQMQQIQSLGQALAWLEKELTWGVEPTTLGHLCGRIGELYAAVVTNGQMATVVNQRGYDVVTPAGERISVKTTAQARHTGQVTFNASTLTLVDRVMVLRVDTEEMQVETLLDKPLAEAKEMLAPNGAGGWTLSLSKLNKRARPQSLQQPVNEVTYGEYLLRDLEGGTIEISLAGQIQSPTKPILRELAARLNVSLVNSNGTRTTPGSWVLKSSRASRPSPAAARRRCPVP